MNKNSSRSHTVFVIEMFKVTTFNGKKSQTESTINLVDLAGSEKVEDAQTTGDRLKEGTAINSSLSALGNVITALAKNSNAGKGPKVLVPYRDSVLTKILRESLGGNSSTIMCCAIRPGCNYYQSTLDTLKYADRAKQIKNAPTINESPQDKLIRELKEENERLKKELAMGGGGGGAGSDPETMRRLKDAEADMERNKQKLEQMENWEAQLKA